MAVFELKRLPLSCASRWGAAGGGIRGPARKCAGIRQSRQRQNAPVVRDRPGTDSPRPTGPVYTCNLLVQELLIAKRDLKLARDLKRTAQYEALIIDDIGYVQQSREEMEVLFTLLADRYERSSIMITSNLPFSKWEADF